MPRIALPLLLAGALVLPAGAVAAETYEVDPTYTTNGVTQVDFGASAYAEDIELQPDGNAVVAGWDTGTGSARSIVTRTLAGGGVDPGFGDAGKVVLDPPFSDQAFAVAVKPDGGILVAGGIDRGFSGSSLWYVARLLPDGTTDTDFGFQGFATIDTGSRSSGAVGMAVMPDGRIVVVGTWGDSVMVARLLPTGDLDPAFDGDGKATADVSSLPTGSTFATPVAVAVDSVGRVVVTGTVRRNSVDDVLVVRYTASGALDTAFGTGGVVSSDFSRDGGTYRDRGVAVKVLADDSIVVGGDSANTSGGVGRVFIARYSVAGALDPTFGAGAGVFVQTGIFSSSASALERDSQGRFVVSGFAQLPPAGMAGIGFARFTSTGALDTTLDGDGTFTADFHPGTHVIAVDFALATDGTIVTTYGRQDYPNTDVYVGRLRVAVPPPPPPPPPPRSGYWMVGAGGAVYAFGDARWYGNAPVGRNPAVDIEPTPSGNGYWIVDSAGHVFSFGDAAYFGGVNGALAAGESVTSMSADPTGPGYWLFTTTGRVEAFGGAVHHGDMRGKPLNGPVLDSIATPSGNGYYMVASDGGIFAFGDAVFRGSMGGKPLNAPVQSLVPDPDGAGYWLVASDGGIFSFMADFHGSMGGRPLNKPVTGMVGYRAGYLMVAEDGGIFAFGDAPFRGSLGSNPPSVPVVSVAALLG